MKQLCSWERDLIPAVPTNDDDKVAQREKASTYNINTSHRWVGLIWVNMTQVLGHF